MIQVQLTTIWDKSMKELPLHISERNKTPFGEITVRDIMLNEDWLNHKIIELSEQDAFGYGVYIFYLNDKEVYIGKVVSNFKHRMLSHQAFDNRVNFGFNRLAKYIYENQTGLPYQDSNREDFNEIVLPRLRKFPVVLINCHGTSVTTKMADRMERVLSKAFHNEGYTIVSAQPKVRAYNHSHNLKALLNIS